MNLSSQLGYFVWNGSGAYSMTKFAVKNFSDSLRRELNRFGVRIANVCPVGYNKDSIEDERTVSDGLWNRLEDSLKSVYGDQDYYLMWKNRTADGLNQYLGHNTRLVLDDMKDAIVNCNPKEEYHPLDGPIAKFMGVINRCGPDFLLDLFNSY